MEEESIEAATFANVAEDVDRGLKRKMQRYSTTDLKKKGRVNPLVSDKGHALNFYASTPAEI